MSGKTLRWIEQGLALKRARKQRALTQRQVLDAIGLREKAEGTIQNWERGVNKPRAEFWGLLTNALGVDVTQLYTGRKNMSGEARMRSVNPDAVLSIIESIERQVSLLRTLCARPVSSRKVVKHGFRRRRKTATENIEKSEA